MRAITFVALLAMPCVTATDEVKDGDNVYIKYYNQVAGDWEYLGNNPSGTYCAAGGPQSKKAPFVIEYERECMDNDLKSKEGDRTDTSFPQKGLRLKYAGDTSYLGNDTYLYAATTGSTKYDAAATGNSKQFFRNARRDSTQFFLDEPFELQDLYVWSHQCVNLLTDAGSYTGGDSMHWVEDPYKKDISASKHNCTFHFETVDLIQHWNIVNLTFVAKPNPENSKVTVYSHAFCNSGDVERTTSSYGTETTSSVGEKDCHTFTIDLNLKLGNKDSKVGGGASVGYQYQACTDTTSELKKTMNIPSQTIQPFSKFEYKLTQMEEKIENAEFKAMLRYTDIHGEVEEQPIGGKFSQVSYSSISENFGTVYHNITSCSNLGEPSPVFV